MRCTNPSLGFYDVDYYGLVGLAAVGRVAEFGKLAAGRARARRLGLLDLLDDLLQDVAELLDVVGVTWDQMAQAVVVEFGRVGVARVVEGDGAVDQGIVGAEDVQGGDVDDGAALVGQLGGTLAIFDGQRRRASEEDGKLVECVSR